MAMMSNERARIVDNFTSAEPTLGEIQASAARLAADRSWPAKTPSERMLYLIAEVGELAAELTRLSSAAGPAPADAIGAEIYDVIWNACDLGRLLNIDLDAAADRKAALNQERSW